LPSNVAKGVMPGELVELPAAPPLFESPVESPALPAEALPSMIDAEA
jgi:hypothetical protein